MLRNTKSPALWVFIAVLLSACAAPPPPYDILSPENALVYGYVESEDPIDLVEFHKFGEVYIPPFKTPPRVLIFRNGNFMAENIKPGKYYLAAFYSNLKKFSMVSNKQAAYQIIVDVKPGSLTYIGSHRIYKKHNQKNEDNPDIKQILNPGERQILRDIYQVTAGTGWQAKVARRLQDLHQ